MQVFGDSERREALATKLDRIRAWLTTDCVSPIGIVRHAGLVAALIEAGELVQGLADDAFARRGGLDARSAGAGRAMDLTLALAQCVAASWLDGFAPCPTLPFDELAALDPADLPGELAIRQPEGYAHYCLYPEAYLVAARSLAGLDVRVVGLRSIGTSLAAMVAAAADAPAPITLRPVGHPFRRELALDPELDTELTADTGAIRAIVDEGPGRSGSSIACVVERLEWAEIPSDRIRLFPSHGNGPGADAPPNARRVWSATRSDAVSFDDLALGPERPHQALAAWVRDLVGDPLAPLCDLSGGEWRALRLDSEAVWPPVLAWQERRKFLIETSSGRFLLKFAGLGRVGMAMHDRARRLADAGFCPEVIGWRHGFLIERWRDDAAPLSLAAGDRPAFLLNLGRYLAFRASTLPSASGEGADLASLARMAEINIAQVFGPQAAARLAGRLTGLARWQPLVRRVETDNRLHAWEWLDVGGRYLKTDAVDHHAGHDLVGAQDIVWDIAGAICEFDLTRTESDALVAQIERQSGRSVLAELMYEAIIVFYCTFQLGYYLEAAASCPPDEEKRRIDLQVQRYRFCLKQYI